jgi:hypothetical protein
MIGSANGGTMETGLFVVVNGTAYPVVTGNAAGGTVIGSADGGMGNTASLTMPGAVPAGPPPPSGPPPGAIEDPNGGPPSPDSMMRNFGPPPPPRRSMQWPFPAPPKPRY